MVIDHNHSEYRHRWRLAGADRFNGAYFYSKEIAEHIIPNINTRRHWVTINIEGACADHSIVFIHDNMNPSVYDWLKDYKDLVLVCGVPSTCEKVAHLGKPVYLPLSIDVDEVTAHRHEKTKQRAFAGRKDKMTYKCTDCDIISEMPRSMFLDELSRYREVYAVGRVALEAKALGCKILQYDDRFMDVDFWQVLDNADVVPILQKELDEIDYGRHH
jgi:hypothetical protein